MSWRYLPRRPRDSGQSANRPPIPNPPTTPSHLWPPRHHLSVETQTQHLRILNNNDTGYNALYASGGRCTNGTIGHTYYCINVYHELDESHCSILNILGELLDCKSESSYIDCLNPDDIDCMVYCILTQ